MNNVFIEFYKLFATQMYYTINLKTIILNKIFNKVISFSRIALYFN